MSARLFPSDEHFMTHLRSALAEIEGARQMLQGHTRGQLRDDANEQERLLWNRLSEAEQAITNAMQRPAI